MPHQQTTGLWIFSVRWARREVSGKLISIASRIGSEPFDRETLIDHDQVFCIGQVMNPGASRRVSGGADSSPIPPGQYRAVSQLSRQNTEPSMKTSFLNARAPVAVLTLAIAQLAHAHALPKHEVPAAGATVSSSQNSVAIDFDDGLEPEFSAITVTDARGSSVTSGKAVVDPSNAKHMWVALNALTPGMYTVTWVAVAADGHRTEGEYTFTVK
jgi:methionine-rich copper-binding protein CopC